VIKVKLSEICDLQNGYAFKSSDYVENSNTLSCRMSNIRLGGIFDIEYNPRFLPDSFADQYKGFLLKDGDLVIAMTDLANDPKLLGVPTLVQTDGRNILLNQRVGKLIIKDSSKVDNKYLQHVLNDPKTREYYRKFASGGLQINLGKTDLLNVEIPLPPLAEQRRIASILDQADELRQKRQQVIEKLDQLLQATFIDMFGDPVSNPKGWDKLTIEKMLNNEKYSLKRGPFGGALKKEIFVESGYLVYEQYHALNNDFSFQRYFIDEDKYNELKAFGVKPKDIIVSCSGVNLGKLAEVPEGSPAGIINQALLKISLNQSIILNDVFIDIFMHPSFKKAFYGDFRGAAIPNFPPMSVFKEFEFIVPPLEIQKKYQSVKSQVKALQKNHQLADEMNLFSSLQNQAFNGTL